MLSHFNSIDLGAYDFYIDQLCFSSQGSVTLELLLKEAPNAVIYTLALKRELLHSHPQLSRKTVVSLFQEMKSTNTWWLKWRYWLLTFFSLTLIQKDDRPIFFITAGTHPTFFQKNGKKREPHPLDIFYIHHPKELLPFSSGKVSKNNSHKINLKIPSVIKDNGHLFFSYRPMITEHKMKLLLPAFLSEQFPFIEAELERDGLSIFASGIDEKMIEQTLLVAIKIGIKRIWVFGSSLVFSKNFSKKYKTQDLRLELRFEQDYCDSTLQGAFLQSKVTICFETEQFSPLAMASLSSFCPLIIWEKSLLDDLIPLGLAHRFQSLSSLEDILSIIYLQSPQYPLHQEASLATEARRFSLRFNEKNFLHQFKKQISLLR